MGKREIRDRSDIEFLVRTFYAQVREHPDLGLFFNKTIDNWEDHFQKLINFWETNLFHVRKYVGNPMRTHINVDKQFEGKVENEHFGYWLQLWVSTLDAHFEGANKERLKDLARNMAGIIFMRLLQARKERAQ